MEEIGNGIYRYADKLESDKKPLVLVHPWYDDTKLFGYRKINDGNKGDYKSNLAKLLIDSVDRNIVLFEEYMDKNSSDYVAHDAHYYGAIFGVLFTFITLPEVFVNFFAQIIRYF